MENPQSPAHTQMHSKTGEQNCTKIDDEAHPTEVHRGENANSADAWNSSYWSLYMVNSFKKIC